MRMSRDLVVGARSSPALTGDIVEIMEGPLVGRLARCTGISGRRALIVIELKGREFEMELDRDWVSSRRMSVLDGSSRSTTTSPAETHFKQAIG
jgi:hypothetical protein